MIRHMQPELSVFKRVLFLLLTAYACTAAAPAPAEVCLYVANQADGTVSVIDANTNQVAATIAVGETPNDVAVRTSDSGISVYVTNRGDNTVSVIDTATVAVVDTIGVEDPPNAVAVTPDGESAYVTSQSGALSVIDTTTGAVSPGIAIAGSPEGIAIAPDGLSALVANSATDEVVVIDTVTNSIGDTFSVGVAPTAVSITPTGDFAYVSSRPVAIVKTATGEPDASFGLRPTRLPRGIAITPDGALALLCVEDTASDGVVLIINTDPVLRTLPLPGILLGETATPTDIAISPDSSTAYTTITSDHEVAVVDIATESVTALISVGNEPNGIAIAELPHPCDGRPEPTATPTPEDTATATATEPAATATPEATPTSTPPACPGDCNGDLAVAINELIVGVNIALGTTELDRCLAFDLNDDGQVSINELIAAVNAALGGCPGNLS